MGTGQFSRGANMVLPPPPVNLSLNRGLASVSGVQIVEYFERYCMVLKVKHEGELLLILPISSGPAPVLMSQSCFI